MKKLLTIVVVLAALTLVGCKNSKKANTHVVVGENNTKTDSADDGDSTLYGVCGDGSAMHTLQLITDAGDTIDYLIDDSKADPVQGGLMAGDRMAVVGYKDANGEYTATSIINLTTLLGKWVSLDKNFEIQEGGTVKCYIKEETNPWTSWKIYNGKLVLNRDTFTIDNLGADSLYLENNEGIFTFKREK
ncbi:MAG TPA: hypothetical protein DCS83_08365 [Prevotella sp.]|nr:hypothetical protein [Prevotella sp.]